MKEILDHELTEYAKNWAADVLELAAAAEGPSDRSDGPGATLPA